jgi:hypothetical protein
MNSPNNGDELMELRALYQQLRRDAQAAAHDLLVLQRLYLAMGTVLLVTGAIMLAFPIASIVLTWLGVAGVLEAPTPVLLLLIAVAVAPLVVGGWMDTQAERLKTRYASLAALSKSGQG